MGKLKNAKQRKNYQLTRYEYDFIKSIAVARNQAYNQYQVIISTFLSYLAGTKWGYETDKVLDFELDDEKQSVKVSEHDDSKDPKENKPD